MILILTDEQLYMRVSGMVHDEGPEVHRTCPMIPSGIDSKGLSGYQRSQYKKEVE